ncbi:hypothetical protein SLA2020_075450 [Shorea laevis]
MLNNKLPEEVVIDILSQLPADMLVRFKCVCKSWYALIESPEFLLFTLCYSYLYRELSMLSADSLAVESSLELLDEDSLRKDTALPAPEWSSDRIALLAEFCYMPRLRR